ncbi:MAG: methyl-accepting chemotaxis protein [Pseudobdellovibrionaceae bacterium]
MKIKYDCDDVILSATLADESFFCAGKVLCDLNDAKIRAHSVAAATEEMTCTVGSIHSSSTIIANNAKNTNDATMKGIESLSQVKEQLLQVAEIADRTIDSVDKLNSITDRIASFAQQIDNISKKTNLLSLNATIEASRAGEAGKGFAVVAGEVKNLSAQIGESTSGIHELISILQNEMESITRNSQENKSALNSGITSLQDVNNLMGDIHSQSSEVAEGSSIISSSLDQQTLAAKEISETIQNISTRLVRMHQSTEEITVQIDSVAKLSKKGFIQLEKSRRKNRIVKLAKSDHAAWKKRLANMLIGKEGLNENELASHTSCRLGVWYEGMKNSSLSKLPAFKELEEPHALVHAHGKAAVKLYNQGLTNDSLKEVENMEKASTEVQRLLNELDKAMSS